jgi:hypothetical protein
MARQDGRKSADRETCCIPSCRKRSAIGNARQKRAHLRVGRSGYRGTPGLSAFLIRQDRWRRVLERRRRTTQSYHSLCECSLLNRSGGERRLRRCLSLTNVGAAKIRRAASHECTLTCLRERTLLTDPGVSIVTYRRRSERQFMIIGRTATFGFTSARTAPK